MDNNLRNPTFSKPVITVLLIFGILFSLISIPNHYNFRTYAFDLGINNNALWDYMHFKWNYCTVMDPHFTNLLSDHFSLFPVLISPFAWIFGTYTLLLFQITAMLWGGIGIYLLLSNLLKNSKLALIGMIHFFSMWGIYSALAFDYHDNVIGTMLVPWFLYYIHQNKWKQAIPWFALILISKENIALWMIFICIGMILIYYKEKIKIRILSLFCCSALLYFIIVMTIIMPALSDPGRGYLHFDYQVIGDNLKEAISTIITKPFYTFKLLFTNHLPDSLYDGIKIELWLAVLLSGGVALIRKPQFLFILLPIFAQKLFSDHYEYWGINNHYSIEFVPIITLALYWSLNSISSFKVQKIIAIIFVLITFFANISFIDHRVSKHYKRGNSRFYQKTHYIMDYPVEEIYTALKLIPDDAAVSAQNMLVPHLAFRDKIYSFPTIEDAEYIALIPIDDDKYPFSKEDYKTKINELQQMPGWKKIPTPTSVLILKRDPK